MNDFKLRPYQIAALETIHNDLQIMNNVLLSAIMGSGKTVISCRLVNRYFKETSRRFLILCHKQELVEQFHKTFQEKTDIPLYDIGICCSGLKQKDVLKRITIGTIQTFVNQVYDYSGCDLLIIDESHRIEIGTGSQYDQVINFLQSQNEKLRILGITATPFRMSTGFCFGDKNNKDVLFPKLNHKVTYQELKEQGFLAPLKGEIAIHESYEENMERVDVSGDYNIGQISDVMIRTVHLDTAIEGIKEYCQECKHIVVFCCTIEHAEMLKDMLNQAGENCTTIHSKLTPIERAINMKAWKSGKIRIMTSINILVEGFDFPPLDCLVFARPTLSASLFLQAVGRVLRIFEDKTHGFLLDLTDNTTRFGTDLDNIKVKIPYSVQKKMDEEQEKSLFKICPECDAECHKALFECLECGYVFPEIKLAAAQQQETESVVFEPEPTPPPELYNVEFIEFHRHTPKNGNPDSLRIEYHNGSIVSSRICSEWLPFDNDKARFFAEQKWLKLAGTTAPTSTDDALERAFDEIQKPTQILVGQDGQYQRILEHIFNDDEQDFDNAEPNDYREEPENTDFDDDIPF